MSAQLYRSAVESDCTARQPVALLTGRIDEIGLEIARRLLRDNYTIVVCLRNSGERNLFADKAFASIRVVPGEESLTPERFQEICAKIGQIDSLINCLSAESQCDSDTSIFSQNVDHSISYIRAVSRFMHAGAGGAVVNVLTYPARYRSGYFIDSSLRSNAMAESIFGGAMFAATRQLALELGSARIRVNAISAGWIKTKQREDAWRRLTDREREFLLEEISLGRLGEPSEVAAAAAFLASEKASYLTGTVIDVNGGWWMS